MKIRCAVDLHDSPPPRVAFGRPGLWRAKNLWPVPSCLLESSAVTVRYVWLGHLAELADLFVQQGPNEPSICRMNLFQPIPSANKCFSELYVTLKRAPHSMSYSTSRARRSNSYVIVRPCAATSNPCHRGLKSANSDSSSQTSRLMTPAQSIAGRCCNATCDELPPHALHFGLQTPLASCRIRCRNRLSRADSRHPSPARQVRSCGIRRGKVEGKSGFAWNESGGYSPHPN
jgi:hypothetical protein